MRRLFLIISMLVVFLTTGFSYSVKAETNRDEIKRIRDYINKSMKNAKTPGFGFGIVKGNEIILAEGFGFGDLKEKLPATENTLFAIGSCSKSFTATGIAILKDEGILEWDKPVRNYMPSFTLKDEVISARVTLKDLITHRTGLPEHGLLWYSSDFTREELVYRMRFLDFNKDLRTTFQYNNLAVMAAGYISGVAARSTWEEVIKSRILVPLSMSDTNFSVKDMSKAKDYALPHALKDGIVKKIPYRNLDAIGPAGSINSTTSNMCKFVILHLNNGVFDDKQIVSQASMQELHTPFLVRAVPISDPDYGHSAYALGWLTTTYKGHEMLSHTGGIDGFNAQVTLLPKDKIGIVAFANYNPSLLPSSITSYAIDILLGMEPKDYFAENMKGFEKLQAHNEQSGANDPCTLGTSPSHSIEEYAGTYEHPGYGIFAVTYEDEKLKAQYNEFEFEFEHWNYDVFRSTKKVPFQHVFIKFYYDNYGNIDRVMVPLEPLVDDIVFTRIVEKEQVSIDLLRKLTGKYTLMGQTIIVSIEGDKLIANAPGQPPFEFEPYKGKEFKVKGMKGFSVRFVTDEQGNAIEMVFIQPTGTFSAKRIK